MAKSGRRETSKEREDGLPNMPHAPSKMVRKSPEKVTEMGGRLVARGHKSRGKEREKQRLGYVYFTWISFSLSSTDNCILFLFSVLSVSSHNSVC